MSNRRALSNAVKESKQPKQLSKPKDIDYNSQMGYRDDSPFRNKSSIDINTPTGSIDMSNTGIPLMANGKYLPPYSGTHQFDTNVVTEVPLIQVKKGGGLKSKKYSKSLSATNKFFREHSFFEKPKKLSKKRIYDPNARYYQDGGLTQYAPGGTSDGPKDPRKKPPRDPNRILPRWMSDNAIKAIQNTEIGISPYMSNIQSLPKGMISGEGSKNYSVSRPFYGFTTETGLGKRKINKSDSKGWSLGTYVGKPYDDSSGDALGKAIEDAGQEVHDMKWDIYNKNLADYNAGTMSSSMLYGEDGWDPEKDKPNYDGKKLTGLGRAMQKSPLVAGLSFNYQHPIMKQPNGYNAGGKGKISLDFDPNNQVGLGLEGGIDFYGGSKRKDYRPGESKWSINPKLIASLGTRPAFGAGITAGIEGLPKFMPKNFPGYFHANANYAQSLILPTPTFSANAGINFPLTDLKKRRAQSKVIQKKEEDGIKNTTYEYGGSTDNYVEIDIPKDQIQKYVDGGYIVEDISVPKLNTYAEGGEPCPDGYRKNYLGTDCVPMEAPEQTNDEEWYRNWYANRILQDEKGQQLLETARPKILKRAEKFPEEEWYTKFGSSESGSFEPLTGKITLNRGRLDSNPFLKNEVKFHEKGHYLTSPSMLDPEADTVKEVDAHPIQQLKNYEADVVNQALKERKDVPRKDRKYYDYLKGKGNAKPYTEEISKNLMQVRRLAGFKPGQVITDDDINNFYKQADEKGWTNPDSELFVEPLRNLKDFTKGPEELKMLFNKLAENKAQQENEFQFQTARYGGSLDSYAGGGETECGDDEKWDDRLQKCVKIVQNLSESTIYDPEGKKIQTTLFQKLKDAKDAYQNFTKQHRGKKYRLNDADSASSIEQLRKGIQLYKDEYAKEQESTKAELKKLENLKSKAALKGNTDIQNLSLKDLSTTKGKMKIDAAIRNSNLDSGTIAALYKGFNLDTVDRNVMKEGYKGQWQDAVDEANARKEANMGVTTTALELLGGGAYRVFADPIGTAKGVGQTVGDIATLPFGLATGVYNYATDGNFDMGTNAWGDSYGKGLSQTGDLLSAIPGLGAVGKLAKFTKAGDLVSDLGKGFKTFGKAAKNKYINAAEGDNMFNYAWRSPASRFDDAAIKPTQEIGYPQSQAEFNKLRSLDNLTDQEKVMIKDYETYSRHYTGRGMQDGTNNPFLAKKQAFEQTIGNAKVQSDEPFVMTRRINTENPELFNMNKGVYEPKRITSWSAGRDNIGNTEFSGGKDRLVIKNKAGESNVFKNQYEGLTDAQKQQYKELLKKESPDRPDEFIDRHIQDFANTNRSFERELILPADVKLKQLGKIKNKIGGYDYVMKPFAKPNAIKTPAKFQNRVFDSNIQLGSFEGKGHLSEKGYNYRTLGDKEIKAIQESKGVFPKTGKAKGGNENVKYWTKGNEKNWYAENPNQQVIRVKENKFNNDKVVNADNVELYNHETGTFKPIISSVPNASISGRLKQFFDRPPGPMMLLGPSGGTNMVKKNIPYYEQLLNTYDSKVMSATNKKFYKDLISTAKKQDGMLTEAQLRELDRLKTGNFDFGKKGYAKGGTTNDYIEMDIPKSKVQWYIDNGYEVEVLE